MVVTLGTRGDVKPCVVGGSELAIMAGADGARWAGAILARAARVPARPALGALAVMRAAMGLPLMIEVEDPRQIAEVSAVADGFAISERQMQNFALLTAAGETDMPVLLARACGATVHELIMAAEYVFAKGNRRVILCERGVRTFEASRDVLDLGAVVALKRETSLPVIVDPTAGGPVLPLALASVASGADGLVLDGHADDEAVVRAVGRIASVVGRRAGCATHVLTDAE
jgi:3-deoxy-7-phosphoheptulonate synthase